MKFVQSDGKFEICLDTPGFENENRTKPEETKIISAGAGLAQPETVAQSILSDSLVNEMIFEKMYMRSFENGLKKCILVSEWQFLFDPRIWELDNNIHLFWNGTMGRIFAYSSALYDFAIATVYRVWTELALPIYCQDVC